MSIEELDLRYIPDDIPPFTDTFPRPPESVATEISFHGYEAPSTFRSALKHTQTKCSWDETPPSRTKALRKKFTALEMADMDLNVRNE